MASPVEPAVVFIDQTGQTIQVQPSQQPIIILNGDNREFSQLPLGNIGNMSIINVNQIQRWNEKPITLTLAEPEPIFTGLIPTISDGLKTDSENTNEVVQNSPKSSMANIIPGARKSAPGSIAPPQSNSDEDLISCFLCPGLRFTSRDVLNSHCHSDHTMENFINTFEYTRTSSGAVKCPFCIFRALSIDQTKRHLKRAHSPEDIFLLSLSLQQNENNSRVRKRQRKPTQERKPPEIEAETQSYPMFCSLCDSKVQARNGKSASDLMREHLRDEHRIIRNAELPLSICSFGLA